MVNDANKVPYFDCGRDADNIYDLENDNSCNQLEKPSTNHDKKISTKKTLNNQHYQQQQPPFPIPFFNSQGPTQFPAPDPFGNIAQPPFLPPLRPFMMMKTKNSDPTLPPLPSPLPLPQFIPQSSLDDYSDKVYYQDQVYGNSKISNKRDQQMLMRYPVWRSFSAYCPAYVQPFNECVINIPEGYCRRPWNEFRDKRSKTRRYRCNPPYTVVPTRLYDTAMYRRLYAGLPNPYHLEIEEDMFVAKQNKKDVLKESESINKEKKENVDNELSTESDFKAELKNPEKLHNDEKTNNVSIDKAADVNTFDAIEIHQKVDQNLIKSNSLYDIDFSKAQFGVNHLTIRQQPEMINFLFQSQQQYQQYGWPLHFDQFNVNNLKSKEEQEMDFGKNETISDPDEIVNEQDFSNSEIDNEMQHNQTDIKTQFQLANQFQQFSEQYSQSRLEPTRRTKKRLQRNQLIYRLPYASTLPTFDYYLVPSALEFSHFQESATVFEQQLEEKCRYRLFDLTPSTEEYSTLAKLVLKVEIVLNKLKAPLYCDALKIASIEQVGAFRMGVILRDNYCACLVITLRSLPVKAALQAFGNRLTDELQKLAGQSAVGGSDDGSLSYYSVQLRNDVYLEVIRKNDGRNQQYDCHSKAIVQLHFTVTPDLAEKLEPQVHLPISELAKNRLLLLQAKWYEQQQKQQKTIKIKVEEDPEKTLFLAQNSDQQSESILSAAEQEEEDQEKLPALIRLLSDIAHRFSSHFSALTHWMIVVLAHYTLTKSFPPSLTLSQHPFSKKPSKNCKNLSVGVALKRLLQLISSGIFLPYSTGIVDPVDPLTLKNGKGRPLHSRLSIESQEKITRAGQTLLRVMTLEGGLNYLLGIQPLPFGVAFVTDSEDSNALNAENESDNDDDDDDNRNYSVLSQTTEWKDGIIVTPGKSVLKNWAESDDKKAVINGDRAGENKGDGEDYLEDSTLEDNLERRHYSAVDHPDDYDLAVFNLNKPSSTAVECSSFKVELVGCENY